MMIFKNIGKVFMRGLIFAIVFKIFYEIWFRPFNESFTNFKEFLIFPIILIRIIIMFLYNFVNRQILGNVEE